MRIWSLHPKYLDAKGLVALWRETLLAKHVLEGRTKGYRNHPQLTRFKKAEEPVELINQYLSIVLEEAESRGYNFDRSKIDWNFSCDSLTVTEGQLQYEWQHLLRKLETRDPSRFQNLHDNRVIQTHPVFAQIKGEVEDWEIR